MDLEKHHFEELSKKTGYAENVLAQFQEDGELRVFSDLRQFVYWYYEDNAGDAVDSIVWWFVEDNQEYILNPKIFLVEMLDAIMLKDGTVVYIYE